VGIPGDRIKRVETYHEGTRPPPSVRDKWYLPIAWRCTRHRRARGPAGGGRARGGQPAAMAAGGSALCRLRVQACGPRRGLSEAV
jgi:hypothetical protein